jgi:NAD(P)-dependent dehydrogenase (short-subunit alcohol dehydrogenase family)
MYFKQLDHLPQVTPGILHRITTMAPFPSPTKIYRDNTYPTLSPTRPELSAKGKTVIVTGGGTGIGAETARYFAEAGASRIGLIGRREQPLLDTKASIAEKFPNVNVIAVSADVARKSDVDAAFATIVGDGKLHVLISGAAIIGPISSIKEVDGEKFLAAIDINIRMATWSAQAFLRHAVPDAVVVNMSSSGAHVNFGGAFGSYSVAKLAIFRLWDLLADGNPNFNIFHIQPGVVNTAMNKEAGGIEVIGCEDHGKRYDVVRLRWREELTRYSVSTGKL